MTVELYEAGLISYPVESCCFVLITNAVPSQSRQEAAGGC